MTGTELRDLRAMKRLSQAKLSELTGISQHLLSAFELGKSNLSLSSSDLLIESLSDDARIEKLVLRAKRYQKSSTVQFPKISDRQKEATAGPANYEFRQDLEELWSNHIRSDRNGLRALSLFSGAGGFSLGFSAAGFSLQGYLEISEGSRAIYEANFSGSRSLGADISLVTSDILRTYSKRIGPVDVLIGGPPCQGFSLAGKRDASDPRNSLFQDYMRFVHGFRPKIALLENVRLLTSMRSTRGEFIKDEICAQFEENGYRVRYFEINAKNYGVPQHRERVLFVATRADLQLRPEIPLSTHGSSMSLFPDLSPYRSFADACSDLPFIESGQSSDDPLHVSVDHPSHVIDWLWDVPQGKSAHDNVDSSKRPPSGYNTTYKRQIWNEPASTIQTTFGMISGSRNVHPIATRSLTVREAARIQSFPDRFKLPGSLGVIRTAIGNAVPPLLAYRIAQYFRNQLLSL